MEKTSIKVSELLMAATKKEVNARIEEKDSQADLGLAHMHFILRKKLKLLLQRGHQKQV